MLRLVSWSPLSTRGFGRGGGQLHQRLEARAQPPAETPGSNSRGIGTGQIDVPPISSRIGGHAPTIQTQGMAPDARGQKTKHWPHQEPSPPIREEIGEINICPIPIPLNLVANVFWTVREDALGPFGIQPTDDHSSWPAARYTSDL